MTENSQRVELDINIQLRHIRAAFSELTKVQGKLNDIQNTQVAAATTLAANIPKTTTNTYSAPAVNNAQKSLYNDFETRADVGAGLFKRRADIEEKYKATSKKYADEARAADRKVKLQQLEEDKKFEYARLDFLKSANAKRQQMMMEGFKAAFSLHIIQMYVAPFVQALQTAVTQTITVFAEFEKYYADYVAKSADFDEVMSRQTIYESGVNQVYSITQMADAMERFAASGIDITKNQQALTDVMQLAVTANIDYNEAANAVIKTQEAFQLSVKDSTMIVDALTNAANSSTAELKDLTEWFGYASGMSHEAGINVQQLAAYLGILSSTGMKSAGTAFRQMLVQFTDTGVRDKFNQMFGQDFDYLQMDQVIGKMREYVQESENQAIAIQKISEILGGKVNAREALARLLTADEDTWTRITSSVERSGTAAELFNTMTDNASAQIDKIKNNLKLMMAQIGQAIAPVLTVLEKLTTFMANTMNATPEFVKKWIFGGILLLGAAISALMMLLTTTVGLFYVVTAALGMFSEKGVLASFSIRQLIVNFMQLNAQMATHLGVSRMVTTQTGALAGAVTRQRLAVTGMSSAMKGAGIAMIAYMGQQYAITQNAYGMAKALNFAAAAAAAVSTFLYTGGGLQGAILGGIAGGATLYAGQSSISRAEQDYTVKQRMSRGYDNVYNGGTASKIDASTNFYIYGQTVEANNTEDFMNAMFAEEGNV